MSRYLCAVDFSTSEIQVLVRGRSRVSVWATQAELPSEAIEDGKVLQPTAVELFVTRMLKDLNLKRPELRVAVSDSACVTRVVGYPKMPARDLERSLGLEASRELPMSRRDAYLGWQVVDETDTRLSILLVGAWRDVVEGYLEALRRVGLVTVAEPRSLALARAVGMQDVVLADWTGERIQVAVVERSRVTYTANSMVSEAAATSPARLAHVLAGILPKAAGRGGSLPTDLVLLGKLHGRDDLADSIAQAGGSHQFDVMHDWRPADPFGALAHTSQVANIGLLQRN